MNEFAVSLTYDYIWLLSALCSGYCGLLVYPSSIQFPASAQLLVPALQFKVLFMLTTFSLSSVLLCAHIRCPMYGRQLCFYLVLSVARLFGKACVGVVCK